MLFVPMNILKWMRTALSQIQKPKDWSRKFCLCKVDLGLGLFFLHLASKIRFAQLCFKSFLYHEESLQVCFLKNKSWKPNATWVTTAQALGTTKHCDTLMKAGHTIIMPNTPQSSSRVSDCYRLWIYYLDDTDEEISRRVNVCLQGSCMLTLLTRAEPKTKAPSQHTSWPAAAAGCGQKQESAVIVPADLS